MSDSTLSEGEFRKLLACIREVSHVSDVEDFHCHVANATRGLIGGDWVSCESFEQGSIDYIQGIVVPEVPPDLYQVFMKRAAENPMLALLRGDYGGHGMKSWRGVLGGDKAHEKIPLYHDFYKHCNIDNQLAVWSFEPDGTLLSYCLSRKGEYHASEQQTLEMLLPHLVNAYRSWQAMGVLKREPKWLEDALEQVGSGVVLLDSAGRVVRWTPFAEGLLTRYFSGTRRSVGRLPRAIARWVKACIPQDQAEFITPEPCLFDLHQDHTHVRLSVRITKAPTQSGAGYLLIMREATSAPTPETLQARFGLSRRRAEVLHLLAKGIDSKAIAQTLGLSVGTVRKHVELLFRDLGVASRAEAVARVGAHDVQ